MCSSVVVNELDRRVGKTQRTIVARAVRIHGANDFDRGLMWCRATVDQRAADLHEGQAVIKAVTDAQRRLPQRSRCVRRPATVLEKGEVRLIVVGARVGDGWHRRCRTRCDRGCQCDYLEPACANHRVPHSVV
jgi:hypothetical protein